MDKRMDERKSPCVLQDFVPFGAAAQKEEEERKKKKKTKKKKKKKKKVNGRAMILMYKRTQIS